MTDPSEAALTGSHFTESTHTGLGYSYYNYARIALGQDPWEHPTPSCVEENEGNDASKREKSCPTQKVHVSNKHRSHHRRKLDLTCGLISPAEFLCRSYAVKAAVVVRRDICREVHNRYAYIWIADNKRGVAPTRRDTHLFVIAIARSYRADIALPELNSDRVCG